MAWPRAAQSSTSLSRVYCFHNCPTLELHRNVSENAGSLSSSDSLE